MEFTELTAEQKAVIVERVLAIQEAFIPTDDAPVADTFYVVSTYNKQYPDEVIDGNTYQMVMDEYYMTQAPAY